MEWVLLVLAAGGGGSYAVWRLRERRDERRVRAKELEDVRALAFEDVTIFGDQLQRLGQDLADRELDLETRDDYQAALDAYERAKFTAPRLGSTDELSTVIDTLATGRYSLACVRARVAGEPVPELRVPCFFNPQHGPSARDVIYTVPRRGTKKLPACTMCASRVAQREKPEVRTVEIGSRKVPYWEAGAAYLPYTQGYFPAQASAVAAVTWAYDLAALESFSGQPGGMSGQDFPVVGDFGGDIGEGSGL